jgi:quercetin dioxygenase-like cupin family protein
MKIIEVKDAGRKETAHKVDVRPLISNQHIATVHITLEPAESLKKHITPVDALFYVLEGNPTIEIGEEQQQAGPDTIIESPARIPHRIMNETESRARILVMKVPKPVEQSKIL